MNELRLGAMISLSHPEQSYIHLYRMTLIDYLFTPGSALVMNGIVRSGVVLAPTAACLQSRKCAVRADRNALVAVISGLFFGTQMEISLVDFLAVALFQGSIILTRTFDGMLARWSLRMSSTRLPANLPH